MPKTKRNNLRKRSKNRKRHSKKVQRGSGKFKAAALAVMAANRFKNIESLKEIYDDIPNIHKTLPIKNSIKKLFD